MKYIKIRLVATTGPRPLFMVGLGFDFLAQFINGPVPGKCYIVTCVRVWDEKCF